MCVVHGQVSSLERKIVINESLKFMLNEIYRCYFPHVFIRCTGDLYSRATWLPEFIKLHVRPFEDMWGF